MQSLLSEFVTTCAHYREQVRKLPTQRPHAEHGIHWKMKIKVYKRVSALSRLPVSVRTEDCTGVLRRLPLTNWFHRASQQPRKLLRFAHR